MPNERPSVLLHVSDGKQVRTKHAFDSDLVRIGRDPDSDVVLPDPSISRLHVRLEREGAEIWLVDHGSSNGTLINGHVRKTKLLETGDVIQLGRYRIWVELLSAGQVQPPDGVTLDHSAATLPTPAAEDRRTV